MYVTSRKVFNFFFTQVDEEMVTRLQDLDFISDLDEAIYLSVSLFH